MMRGKEAIGSQTESDPFRKHCIAWGNRQLAAAAAVAAFVAAFVEAFDCFVKQTAVVVVHALGADTEKLQGVSPHFQGCLTLGPAVAAFVVFGKKVGNRLG